MPCDRCQHVGTTSNPVYVVCPDDDTVVYLCRQCLPYPPTVPTVPTVPMCHHGHTAREVRLLPCPDGSHMTVCYRHYLRELYWRLGGCFDAPLTRAHFPEWSTLPPIGAQP